MRMYTLHFGQGLEHTDHLFDQAKGNLPYLYTGFSSGNGPVTDAGIRNCQIVSHKEIFKRYEIKGGHGEYCLETWDNDDGWEPFACQLFTGGWGDLPWTGHDGEMLPFYFKFDFMYTSTSEGEVLMLQRSKTGKISRDFTLSLDGGYLHVQGSQHITQPVTDPPTYFSTAWMPRLDGQRGTIYLEPDKWHEIQLFINPNIGWDVSNVGPDPIMRLSYVTIDPFKPAFESYENEGPGNAQIAGSETVSGESGYPLRMDQWPVNGHPFFPNVMLPGQDQTAWPPENQASGQYFYGDNLGMAYVWVNGKLDIQHTTNMCNERTDEGWGLSYSMQSLYLGFSVGGLESDQQGGRFFYDNIIMNDSRNPSGSYPSQIFDPSFSTHESLEWNPNYNLKFAAMEMDPDYWDDDLLGSDNGRKHNAWMPGYPTGAMVPSGNPYYVPSPNRFGSPTDGMIPHGTKLTVIHIDWDGELQDYAERNDDPTSYPDFDVDYAHQHVQPNESNPFRVNQNCPHLRSDTSGEKSLFYLKRPPATSGKQPIPGGYGLGGVTDYVPNIDVDLGDTTLPVIYRIWTCVQDHSLGSTSPTDTQHHMIRVPSGGSSSVDYMSTNQCPGDRGWRAYHNGTATISNGYSMADWPYNPVTGDPWTWDDLDAIQIGVSHEEHAGSNHLLAYTIYLVVEHATPPDPEIGILNINLMEWTIADNLPYHIQQKSLYVPGWKRYGIGDSRNYYNRWDISPVFEIDRTDRQAADSHGVIIQPQYSGTISWDYSIKYINGEVVQGDNYRKFDEHFDEVWVYTISGIIPSNPIRHPMRGEVITDSVGNYYTFLTHPVLQWNTKKFPTDPGLSPVASYPYVLYDYTTLYLMPLTMHNIATLLDPEETYRNWTDPNVQPVISGASDATWSIDLEQNAFNFKIDPDSYFNVISPSAVANHALTHPDELLDETFPPSRSGHDEYFRAPHLASGSATQIIYLTDRLGVLETAIDSEVYQVRMGLYQTTVNQVVNDTGEGKFEFFDGDPDVANLISGYTFGTDGIAGWHLNETIVIIPSGTRQVRFTFDAIRNTDGPKSPGGTLGGTSNFAAFDEPFFIMSMSSGYTSSLYHPADVSQDGSISSYELANYIGLWQSGLLPLGVAKDYMTRAERIWQSGTSPVLGDLEGGLYGDTGGPKPDKWRGSGYV